MHTQRGGSGRLGSSHHSAPGKGADLGDHRPYSGLGGGADVALVGIGTVDPDLSSLVRAGYLSPDGVAELRRLGAVGDVCARYCDRRGVAVPATIDRRIIGVGLPALKAIPTVLGVAGGAVKAESLLGALRGGYLDLLVTDREAAERILDENATNGK
jgi:deoxyribonucleoside regulator